MPLSRSRDYLSIGEVLEAIRPDFPDVSISKIRFLEAEGLITPERTGSGYRKFYDPDVARLRYILSLQKDHFLPLRVIRERLAEADATGSIPEIASTGARWPGRRRPMPMAPPRLRPRSTPTSSSTEADWPRPRASRSTSCRGSRTSG